jgi:hypothetical protein
MATYKIILDGLRSFGVEVTSAGRFLSMCGFRTEAYARAYNSSLNVQ